jgi:hypothetical protein
VGECGGARIRRKSLSECKEASENKSWLAHGGRLSQKSAIHNESPLFPRGTWYGHAVEGVLWNTELRIENFSERRLTVLQC